MEAQSRVLWDLLRLTYQRGPMDDVMALNAMSDAVLSAHDRDPELAGRIFSDLFRTVDTRRLGGAMEIVPGGLLDQRPKVVRWTLGTVFSRIRKHIARTEGDDECEQGGSMGKDCRRGGSRHG